MPGDNTPNFAAMTPEEFRAWQASTVDHSPVVRHEETLRRNLATDVQTNEALSSPAGADLTSSAPVQKTLGSAVPQPEPRADVWSTAKRTTDFTCPSGQTCKMVRLQPQTLLEHGLLDKITRLEGLADDLVQEAEGQPPKATSVPSSEDLKGVLEVLGMVIPLVVVEPKVYEDDDKEAPEGAIRVRDIDLEDRMAILEESMRGLKSLDRFRNTR